MSTSKLDFLFRINIIGFIGNAHVKAPSVLLTIHNLFLTVFIAPLNTHAFWCA